MADFNIAINLKANDLNTSQVINGIKGNLRGLSGEFGNLGSASGGRGGGLDRVASGLSTAGAAVNQLTQAGRGVLDPIIKEGVTFERAMAEVLAFGGTKFAPFMDQLHTQARQLGRDTEFTAVQAAQSMRQLAQAGLKPNEIMEQLPTVMDLAKAGALDLAPAAKIVASTLAQFAGSGETAVDVADLLARTANSTQTNVREIGNALQFAGGSADALGLNVEQTSVLLAAMGKSALASGKAGRNLNALFIGMSRLTNPDLRRGLKQIGVDQKQLIANLENKNIPGIVQQFREGFDAKGLGGADKAGRRLEILTKIFGRQGGRAFAALAKLEAQGKFPELTAEIHDFSGAAEQMGQIMSDTAQGDLLRADSALSELKLTIADELLPALRPLLQDVTELVKEFAQWAKENPETVRQVATLALKVVALGTVVGPLLTSASSLVTIISALGKVSGLTAGGGMLQMFKRINGMSPSVSTLIGSKAGFLGMLGAVAAAGAMGVAIGTWLDDTFGISDAIAGLNEEMSIHNELLAQNISLQVGLSKVRGAAKLGDLTKEEQEKIKAAQKEKERLSAELADTGFFTDNSAIVNFARGKGGRTSDDINEDIQRQQRIIDRINKKGLDRQKREQEKAARDAERALQAATRPRAAPGQDEGQGLIGDINRSHFGTNGGAANVKATVVVKVDRDGKFLGVNGVDETGMANGTSMEGL